MQTAKTILAMLALVMIGFAGGFVTHRGITQKHFEEVIEKGVPHLLEDRLIEALELTEKQQETLVPLIQAHTSHIGNLHHQLRVERRALMDSLHHILSPELTDIQKGRLEEFKTRQTRMRHNGKKDRRGFRKREKRSN